MVPPRCMVSYCYNQGKHKFPKDESRRKLWLEAIKDVQRKSIGTYSGLCSDHFRLSDYSVIPSYWNNYQPARILKKSAVPSVFNCNKTVEDEQQSTSVEETLSFDSDLLFVEVNEPSSDQNTVSFNPERVKATYSRGQTLKTLKPNTLPSQKINKPQAQSNKQPQKSESTLTTQNAKNKIYARFKPKKRPARDNSNKTNVLPENNSKLQRNTKLTPSLSRKGTIKMESEIETIFTDDILPNKDDRLTSNLPPEVTSIKTEPKEEECRINEIEIDMLTQIKQETNQEIADINLKLIQNVN